MLTLNFTPFPQLITDRLMLRQISNDDVSAIFSLRSDKKVMQFIDRPLAKTTDDAIQLIQRIIDSLTNNDGITWGITMKNNPGLIGTIGFWRIDKEHHRAEIGYLLHPDQQGKGMMQEAMNVVLDHGFHVMKLHSVEANVNPANEASIRLLERNRFVREAYYKENYFSDGKFLDSAIYSLLTPVK
ncbi:MAG: GNAT family N-acetyltransferase [Chitinophagales bacterium]